MTDPTNEPRKPWFQAALLCGRVEEPDGPGRTVNLIGLSDGFLAFNDAQKPIAEGWTRLQFFGVIRDLPPNVSQIVIRAAVVRLSDDQVVAHVPWEHPMKAGAHSQWVRRTIEFKADPGHYGLSLAVNNDPVSSNVLFRLEALPYLTRLVAFVALLNGGEVAAG